MDKKLTDEEIVQAFKNCDLEKATLYLYDTKAEKVVFIPTVEIFDLINRLQAENERLKSCVKTEKEVREIAKRTMEPLVKEITREQIDIAVKLAKAEAYKECIEKVKERSCKLNLCHNEVVVETDYQISGESLDNLLKELVGEDNG